MGIGSAAKSNTSYPRAIQQKVSIPDGESFRREVALSDSIFFKISAFQSPMGIGSAAKVESDLDDSSIERFQSPMGIGSAAKL